MTTETREWIDFAALKDEAATHWRTVLAHYGLRPRKSGRQLVVPCPFHEDSEPSFKVTPGEHAFHCFGCGAKGNVLDFVKRKGGLGTLPEAAKELARICGIELPMRERAETGTRRPARGHRKPQDARKGPETTKDGSAPDGRSVGPPVGDPEPVAVNQPLTFQLKLDPDHPYRLERGPWLTPDVVQGFGMGYCSRGMMKARWCIPIHDERGDLVAYAGRWVGDDDEIPDGEGKYMLPPREKFDRGLVLFNLHRAAALGCSNVFVVEGYFGAMRLHAELREPVVATMGNSITDAQIALLKGRFERATLLYDGGENGRDAANRAALRMCRAMLPTMIVDLPDGEQPDTIGEVVLRELLGLNGDAT